MMGISTCGDSTTFLLEPTRARYIDTFLDRSVNALSFTQVLLNSLRTGQYLWYLDMDNDKILDEIRRLCDPYSILVIYGRRLYKIRCPFKVRVLVDVAGWKNGDEKWVEKVMVTRDLHMVYLIGGLAYPFQVFQILLH